MSAELPTDLDTEHGALQFADMIFDNARVKFDERGAVGAASFLIITIDPRTEEPFKDGPKISVVEGANVTTKQHEETVRRMARRYRAVGVLTLFEVKVMEQARAQQELTDSEDLNEFLSGVLDRSSTLVETDGTEPTVMVTFEHLKFKPATRVWQASVLSVADGRVLGPFSEVRDVDSVRGFGGFLTFFN
jgi:hypothetical protein